MIEQNKEEYDAAGCLRLVNALIYDCFTIPAHRKDLHSRSKISFAENSRLLTIWCEYAKIDENKMRKNIKTFNQMVEIAFEKKLDKHKKVLCIED